MLLIDKLNNITPTEGELAVFYLGQAGFAIKTSKNRLLIIDAYLSDAAERMFGFKRMIPAIIDATSCNADWWLSTHSHIDHLDIDTLPIVAQNTNAIFIGAPDCEVHYDEAGISLERCVILAEGQRWTSDEVSILAVYADHGELAPEAIGFLIEMEGLTIYHTGDTSFCPEKILPYLPPKIDLLLAPINGQFGNMCATEACQLASIIKPRIVVATHFWMFLEHVSENGTGDPATFLNEAKKTLPAIDAKVMAPGEILLISKNV